jgi:SAM-dependent methyltransferase
MNNQFNESEYLTVNPDVAVAVRNGQFSSGLEHYETYRKKEGRMPNWFGRMTREDKALYALNKKGAGLEIGPSHHPIAPKSRGFNVHILDHASAEELRAKYKGHGVNLDNVENVDFVWSGQSLPDLIGRTACYDWIIASHVIEHVPDLGSFLQQCEALLKTDGVLSLVIPDKRYCFDYFSPPSTTGSVLDAWAEKRIRPSAGLMWLH